MAIICPYCGFENRDSSSFCSNCTESLIESSTKKQHKFQQLPEKQIADMIREKPQQTSACCCCLGFAIIVGIILFLIFFIDKLDLTPHKEVHNNNQTSEEKVPTSLKTLYVEDIDDYLEEGIRNISFQEKWGVRYFNIYSQNRIFRFTFAPNNMLAFDSRNITKPHDFSGSLPNNSEFAFSKKWAVIGSKFLTFDDKLQKSLENQHINTCIIDDSYVWIFTWDGNAITAIVETQYDKNFKPKYQLAWLDEVRLKSLFPDVTETPAIENVHYLKKQNLMLFVTKNIIYCMRTGESGELINKVDVEIHNLFNSPIVGSTFYDDAYWFLQENGQLIPKTQEEILVLAELSTK